MCLLIMCLCGRVLLHAQLHASAHAHVHQEHAWARPAKDPLCGSQTQLSALLQCLWQPTAPQDRLAHTHMPTHKCTQRMCAQTQTHAQVSTCNAFGGLSPSDKLARIRALQQSLQREAGGSDRCLVAMVGLLFGRPASSQARVHPSVRSSCYCRRQQGAAGSA